MKFLDTNIFIYAYYKPKRRLSSVETQLKEKAKQIIRNISEGKEDVIITVVHLSEIVNILKHGLPYHNLVEVVRGLFMLDNLKILGVSEEAYFAAVELAEDLSMEPNDALAVDVMRQNNITEIYTFDKIFSKLDGVIKLPKISKTS
ncbi:MAG: type II toxin-antitoxin system VapC family toxin [Candidatus Ranarchaeia archaeon]